MTRFSASYFIPAADLIWGILTLAQYRVTNVQQLYVIRFFIGAAGSLFFPAVQWYLGCWYKRSELSRRGALFFIASQVGSMSSGYIQSGAYASLNLKHGIEGWRWLYIICESGSATTRPADPTANRRRLLLHDPRGCPGLPHAAWPA